MTFGVEAPPATDPQTLAIAVQNAGWSTAGSLQSLFDSNVTLTATEVRIGQASGEDLLGLDASTKVGTRTGESPPPNVAVLVEKRTARGGRRGRGRIFMPWVVGENVVSDAGIVDPSTRSAVLTSLNVWRNALTTAGHILVLLHRPGISPAGIPDEVTGFVVNPLVSTQKRRLGRA